MYSYSEHGTVPVKTKYHSFETFSNQSDINMFTILYIIIIIYNKTIFQIRRNCINIITLLNGVNKFVDEVQPLIPRKLPDNSV